MDSTRVKMHTWLYIILSVIFIFFLNDTRLKEYLYFTNTLIFITKIGILHIESLTFTLKQKIRAKVALQIIATMILFLIIMLYFNIV